MTERADDGYAIVAAVAALAVFAALALTALQTDRGDLADLRAQMTQARLEAAAGAGLAQAIAGLAVDDPAQRWPIDGRPRSLVFEGVTLTVVVEDERGKLPMADLTDEQVLRLFRAAGASADQAGALADAYQDWLDDDDNPRPKGAETPQYLALGIHPRNGPPVTVDELARLQGMTPAVFARVAPVLTPYFGISGNFEPRNASPLAVAVMSTGGEGGPEAIERQRETEGERTALEIQPDVSLAGRNLTVAVLAQDGQGGSLQRRTVVEFTGRPSPAYYIRELR